MQQPSYPPPGYDPYAQQKKPLTGWLVAGGVLFAALIGFGFGTGFFGLLGGSKPALNQQGQPQAVLPQVSAPAPVFMQEAEVAPITPQEAKRMPQEILDWLKHLEETEKRYHGHVQAKISGLAIDAAYGSATQGMSPKQYSGLAEGDLDQLGQSGASEVGSNATDAHKQRAEEILSFFKSLPPPPECVPIYQTYLVSMNETNVMIDGLADIFKQIGSGNDGSEQAVNSLKSKAGELQEILNTNRSRVDSARKETDDLVRTLCQKYETRKWFSIPGDIGGGVASALAGMGKDLLSGLAD